MACDNSCNKFFLTCSDPQIKLYSTPSTINTPYTLTLPTTGKGNLFIEAWGANGGSISTVYNSGGRGGYAASNFSDFNGKTIQIFVGGGGGNRTNTTSGGGGGGGSFVWLGSGIPIGTTNLNTLLVAVGGGNGQNRTGIGLPLNSGMMDVANLPSAGNGNLGGGGGGSFGGNGGSSITTGGGGGGGLSGGGGYKNGALGSSGTAGSGFSGNGKVGGGSGSGAGGTAFGGGGGGGTNGGSGGIGGGGGGFGWPSTGAVANINGGGGGGGFGGGSTGNSAKGATSKAGNLALNSFYVIGANNLKNNAFGTTYTEGNGFVKLTYF